MDLVIDFLRRNRRKLIIAGVVLLAVFVFAGSCGSDESDTPPRAAPSAPAGPQPIEVFPETDPEAVPSVRIGRNDADCRQGQQRVLLTIGGTTSVNGTRVRVERRGTRSAPVLLVSPSGSVNSETIVVDGSRAGELPPSFRSGASPIVLDLERNFTGDTGSIVLCGDSTDEDEPTVPSSTTTRTTTSSPPAEDEVVPDDGG